MNKITTTIKNFIKRNYFTLIILIFFILYLFFFQKEKISIFSHYNYFNKSAIEIVSPIKIIPADSIENTYGAPRSGGRVHEGIDLFAPYGTPVYSVINGFILFIGCDNLGGNVIKLMGIDNRIYYYAHLSSFADFGKGDKVEADEVIGFIGNSGNARFTPSHLHFEIMTISWLFPMLIKNINPYFELVNATKREYG